MGQEQSNNGGYQQASSNEYPGRANGGGSASGYTPSSTSRSLGSGNNTAIDSADGPPVSAADRAAALEAKMNKRRPKPKDTAAIKDAHWKRYNELGPNDSTSSSTTPPPTIAQQEVGYRLGDSAIVRKNTPTPSTVPSTPSPTAAASGTSNTAQIPNINRSSATPTAAQLLHGQKRYETPEEAAIRAQRAAMFAAPTKANQEKKAAGRNERWKAYSQFEQASAAQGGSTENVIVDSANVPFGFNPPVDVNTTPGLYGTVDAPMSPYYPLQPTAPPADPFRYATPTLHPSGPSPLIPTPSPAPTTSSSTSSASAEPRSSNAHSHFEQQMEYLLQKVTAMPLASITLIRKILLNLLKAGPTPDAEGQKFRKIKLSNPKIQEAVVKTDGGLELLLACGFTQQVVTSTNDIIGLEEPYLIFPDKAPLDIAQLAFDLITDVEASKK